MTTGHREDVSRSIADLLTPRRRTRVGFWNVRTLFQSRALSQAICEMNNYSLAIMGIAEARWTGVGKQTLSSGETIIWSGRQDNDHQEGVTLIIDSKYTNTLLQRKPISERLFYVRLNARHVKLSIIVSYTPIEDADEEDKDNFY